MRTNRSIRVPRVRLIDEEGNQLGIVETNDALNKARDAGLDLVEISPQAHPPVCKIVDYGKFRYEQTKREREQKKGQHQSKLKEVKMKPNIDDHDFMTKLGHAKKFIDKGWKVRFTCMFRGRQMAHPEVGRRVADRFIEELREVAIVEAPPKMMGRNLTMVLSPSTKNKSKGNPRAKDENKQSD